MSHTITPYTRIAGKIEECDPHSEQLDGYLITSKTEGHETTLQLETREAKILITSYRHAHWMAAKFNASVTITGGLIPLIIHVRPDDDWKQLAAEHALKLFK